MRICFKVAIVVVLSLFWRVLLGFGSRDLCFLLFVGIFLCLLALLWKFRSSFYTVERFSDMLCRFYGHDVVKTFETLSPSRISFFSCLDPPNHGTNTPKKSVMPCHWLCQLRNFSHKIQVSGLHKYDVLFLECWIWEKIFLTYWNILVNIDCVN